MHIQPTFNDKELEMQIALTGQCLVCLSTYYMALEPYLNGQTGITTWQIINKTD
jgi:hypothetical protein